jgi:hypothetical protein
MQYKIRQGFVSNSSSASYKVTIVDTHEITIIEELIQEIGFSILDMSNYIVQEENKIETESRYGDLKDKSIDELEAMLKARKGTMAEMFDLDNIVWVKKNLAELKRARDSGSKVEEAKAFAKHLGVDISSDGNNTVLEAGVSMHNSYLDVPKVIQCVLLHSMFEHPDRTIEVEVNHRG